MQRNNPTILQNKNERVTLGLGLWGYGVMAPFRVMGLRKAVTSTTLIIYEVSSLQKMPLLSQSNTLILLSFQHLAQP